MIVSGFLRSHSGVHNTTPGAGGSRLLRKKSVPTAVFYLKRYLGGVSSEHRKQRSNVLILWETLLKRLGIQSFSSTFNHREVCSSVYDTKIVLNDCISDLRSF